MQGIAIISHTNGWSCSNDVTLSADKTLVDIDGKKFSKSIITLKLNYIFDVNSEIVENESVECLFKSDDGAKKAFVGKVKSKGVQTTVIHELTEIDHYYQNILNKIKT